MKDMRVEMGLDYTIFKQPYDVRLCKPTDPRVDWDKVKFDKVDWDCEINGYPYQVVRAEYFVDGLPKKGNWTMGYPLCHCSGGTYGKNNYYVYPLFTRTSAQEDTNEYTPCDPGPTKDNLTKFNGKRGPLWGIQYEPTNHFRKGEVRDGNKITITRNNRPFYETHGSMGYGLSNAQVIIDKLQDHPCNFNSRNWRSDVLNRKIWYGYDPAIIKSIISSQGCVMVIPDTRYCKQFKIEPWNVRDDGDTEMYWHDEEPDAKVDFLYEKINWFRSDEQTQHFMKYRSAGEFEMLEKAREFVTAGRMKQEDVLELEKLIFKRV